MDFYAPSAASDVELFHVLHHGPRMALVGVVVQDPAPGCCWTLRRLPRLELAPGHWLPATNAEFLAFQMVFHARHRHLDGVHLRDRERYAREVAAAHPGGRWAAGVMFVDGEPVAASTCRIGELTFTVWEHRGGFLGWVSAAAGAVDLVTTGTAHDDETWTARPGLPPRAPATTS